MDPISPIHTIGHQRPHAKSLAPRHPSRFRLQYTPELQRVVTQTETTTSPTKSDYADTLSITTKKASLSPTFSPNSISTGPNGPRIELKKLKTGYLDDDAIFDSLDKFSGMIKYRQLEQEQQELSSQQGQSDEKDASPVAKRNEELIRLVQRYQLEKGMANKSKESRFEARLKAFKGLKTFVTNTDAIKSLSDPMKSSPSLKINSDSAKAQSALLPIKSISQASTHDRQRRWPSSIDLRRKVVSSTEGMIQPIPLEMEDMLTYSMRQQLQENIKKHMGNETLNVIHAELKNPLKQREIQKKAKEDMIKMRQTKENLQNNDLLHSLIDHLAGQTKPQAIATVEDEEGPTTSPFFQKFERELHASPKIIKKPIVVDKEEQEEALKAEKEEYKQNLIQKLQSNALLGLSEIHNKEGSETMPDAKKEGLDPEVKAALLLDSYKQKSGQMIKMLKKKANAIHQESLGTNRTNRTDSRDSRYKPSQYEMSENVAYTLGSDYEEKKSINLPSMGDKVHSKKSTIAIKNMQTYESSMLPSQNILNDLHEELLAQRKVDLRRRDAIDHHICRRPEESELGSIMNAVYSLPRRCCVSRKHKVELIRGGKRNPSYERSMENIQGMISSLSVTNKQMGSELKGTMKNVEKFYDSKLNYMKTIELPESLSGPAGYETQKKAGMIMKFASKALRDQIL